jgi:hypothetical protein
VGLSGFVLMLGVPGQAAAPVLIKMPTAAIKQHCHPDDWKLRGPFTNIYKPYTTIFSINTVEFSPLTIPNIVK